MVRRGRCRCGSVLRFQKGPNGYKTRCPSCGAVVRLRLSKKKAMGRGRSHSESRVPDRPETPPRLASDQDDMDAGPTSASEASLHLVPASQPRAGVGRMVTCEVCRTIVPAQATQCPGCGTAFALTTAAPILDLELSSGRGRAPRLPSSRLLIGWLTAGAVLIVAAVIVLTLFLRH